LKQQKQESQKIANKSICVNLTHQYKFTGTGDTYQNCHFVKFSKVKISVYVEDKMTISMIIFKCCITADGELLCGLFGVILV